MSPLGGLRVDFGCQRGLAIFDVIFGQSKMNNSSDCPYVSFLFGELNLARK